MNKYERTTDLHTLIDDAKAFYMGAKYRNYRYLDCKIDADRAWLKYHTYTAMRPAMHHYLEMYLISNAVMFRPCTVRENYANVEHLTKRLRDMLFEICGQAEDASDLEKRNRSIRIVVATVLDEYETCDGFTDLRWTYA